MLLNFVLWSGSLRYCWKLHQSGHLVGGRSGLFRQCPNICQFLLWGFPGGFWCSRFFAPNRYNSGHTHFTLIRRALQDVLFLKHIWCHRIESQLAQNSHSVDKSQEQGGVAFDKEFHLAPISHPPAPPVTMFDQYWHLTCIAAQIWDDISTYNLWPWYRSHVCVMCECGLCT